MGVFWGAIRRHADSGLRRLAVDALEAVRPSFEPAGCWDGAVDESVYTGTCGIRMLGSRKATKLADKGRVYRLCLALGADGQVDDDIFDDGSGGCGLTDVAVLQLCSIRSC